MKQKTYRHLGYLDKILKQVNSFKEAMADLTDQQLKNKTAEFKRRLSEGESLDDLLPEAFAVIREADKRVLGLFPYDVQVIGGIVLHQGDIAEMKTGEGKTLTATLPLYLNALTGRGAMIVTTNEYLSQRDYEDLSPVYRWLGLSVSNAVEDPKSEDKLTAEEKRKIYSADIIYTTNSGYGFDYLFENLASGEEDQYLRDIEYVIIDEIDEVLLDGAQTPLVISGMPRVQSNLYYLADQFIQTLDEGLAYELDEERDNVWLTPAGIQACEAYFKVENLFAPENRELNRQVTIALKANTLFEKNRHYIVADGEVKLLNEQTGRIMQGTKLQSGQHQALEAKENVEISEIQRAMASITYQNLFKKFPKISGMSGTAKVAEKEFQETYGLNVTVIPTNKPVIRHDHDDAFYLRLEDKVVAVVDLVKSVHEKEQPILLATGSVGMSKLFSNILLSEGIPHNVLNAYNLPKEAMIIKEAGQKGAVTIGTSIAGRGTDIKLGQGVAELGGLFVIGTERMESQRIDLQLRGRAGRQGDPGESQFFASLDDQLMAKWATKKMLKLREQGMNRQTVNQTGLLKQSKFQKFFDQAQRASDSRAKNARHMAVEFDESMRIQREIIYQDRRAMINGDASYIRIDDIVDESFDNFIDDVDDLTVDQVKRFIYDHLTYQIKVDIDQNLLKDKTKLKDLLNTIFNEAVESKQDQLNDPILFNTFVRKCVLKAIDEGWIEQVDYMEQFKLIVTSRQYAQRNAITEYEKEAWAAYQSMQKFVFERIVRYLALSAIERDDKGQLMIQFA